MSEPETDPVIEAISGVEVAVWSGGQVGYLAPDEARRVLRAALKAAEEGTTHSNRPHVVYRRLIAAANLKEPTDE